MSVAITKPTNLGRTANQVGAFKERIWDVAFSGSYAAGGEAVTAASVGLHQIVRVQGVVTEAAGATSGLPVLWNAGTSKLQLYESAAAGSPAGEKGAEAYAATTAGRLTFVGT